MRSLSLVNNHRRALVTLRALSSSSQAAPHPTTPPSPPSSSGYPTMLAEVRTLKNYGSSKVRRLRDAGRIPGVIYGVDEDQNVFKIMVSVDEKLIMSQMRERGRSLESTIYEMHLQDTEGGDGDSSSSGSSSGSSGSSSSGSGSSSSSRVTKHLVTPRQLQMNAITDRPLSVNFVKYFPGTRMRIPIEYVNLDQSVDLRRGCFLIKVNRFVECVCGMDVPKALSLDLTGAVAGDVLRLSKIVFPPGVTPARSVPPDFVIGVVKSARGSA